MVKTNHTLAVVASHLLIILAAFYGIEYNSNLNFTNKLISLLIGTGALFGLLFFAYDPPGFFFIKNKKRVVEYIHKIITSVAIRFIISWITIAIIFVGGIIAIVTYDDIPKVFVIYWFLLGGAITSILSNALMLKRDKLDFF